MRPRQKAGHMPKCPRKFQQNVSLTLNLWKTCYILFNSIGGVGTLMLVYSATHGNSWQVQILTFCWNDSSRGFVSDSWLSCYVVCTERLLGIIRVQDVCLVNVDYDIRGTIKEYIRSCQPLHQCRSLSTGACTKSGCCAQTPDSCHCKPGNTTFMSTELCVNIPRVFSNYFVITVIV